MIGWILLSVLCWLFQRLFWEAGWHIEQAEQEPPSYLINLYDLFRFAFWLSLVPASISLFTWLQESLNATV